MRSVLPVVALAATTGIGVGAYHVQSRTTPTPQQAVDELLDADRACSKASGQTDLIAGLSALWADDAVMSVPGGTFARGAAAVTAALRANPENAKARAEWTPVRGSISADGQHGFTFGYMTVRQADRTSVPLKYLAYWVRESAGWKVAAYKRARANEAPESVEMMTPALRSRVGVRSCFLHTRTPDRTHWSRSCLFVWRSHKKQDLTPARGATRSSTPTNQSSDEACSERKVMGSPNFSDQGVFGLRTAGLHISCATRRWANLADASAAHPRD
jgi:ketosteroid isomerase-like protein